MNLLLDTHILLWALASPERLPKSAITAIYQADNVFFSPVNLWEIGTKSSIWAEYNIQTIDDIYAASLKANLQELLISSADMITATQLPLIHKDPFDRILIAQAHNNRSHLITVDSKIAQYQMPYLLIV
jgi:PIN domain nuclease of toxin-antitoxin system